jgi:hypothetical protein
VLAAARAQYITRRRARYQTAIRVRACDLATGEKKYSRELERTVMPVTRQQAVITVSAAQDLIHAAIKANTAASTRRPTGGMGEDLALPLAVATGGRLTNVLGGSPIRFGATHAQ